MQASTQILGIIVYIMKKTKFLLFARRVVSMLVVQCLEKPIFHCNVKRLALGLCIGYGPQREGFALPILICWYLKSLVDQTPIPEDQLPTHEDQMPTPEDQT